MKYLVSFTINYEVEADSHENAEYQAIAILKADLHGNTVEDMEIDCIAADGSRRS